MVTDSWISKFPLSHVQFKEKGLSDHCPAMISTGAIREIIHRPFQFFNHLALLPGFKDDVSNAWSDDVRGDPWYVLTVKLKRVKAALKMMNNSRGDLHAAVDLARNNLLNFQELMPLNPTVEQYEEEKNLCPDLRKALCEEEILLKQKSRIHWLNHGDNNNRFFFSACKGRWNVNKILSLQDDSGRIHSPHRDISDTAVNYFVDLLGVENDTDVFPDEISLPSLNEAQKQSISAPFQAVDVLKTLKSMAKNKCPGPDGFSVEFYLHTWDIVGREVTNGVLYFFDSLQLPRVVNSSAIALVPKHLAAANMRDFRPISCCNVLYKCISKMIAARMRLIMPSIISDSQSAFVPNPRIGDNILLAQSLCRNYNLFSGEPRCTLKLDLRKAFDTVSWKFLHKALLKMGFPDTFVMWIMTCLRTSMLSVKVNGALEGFFSAKSGLRQGDPLSPYLFVISMEVMTACLKNATANSEFKPHWKAVSPAITHLIFADDILLFSRGEEIFVRTLMNGVNLFSAISGLKVNAEKSACFFGNVSSEVKNSILQATGFIQGFFPVTYLGQLLLHQSLKLEIAYLLC